MAAKKKSFSSTNKIAAKNKTATKKSRSEPKVPQTVIEKKTVKEELRLAHAEIKESRSRYSDLYDFAHVGYFTLDQKKHVTEANLTGAKMLGIERSALINKPLSRYIVKDDQNLFNLHHRKLFDTKKRQTCEIKIRRENGTEFYAQMESVAVKDSYGNLRQSRTAITDITKRKRYMEELMESETRFRTLFEQAAVGVAQIISSTGQFVRLNKRYCDIVGYSRDEMEKMTFQEITYPDDLQADLNNMKLLIKGKIPEFSMEKRYFHKNGSIVWVNLTVSPMWRAGETPYYHIAVVEDITARKKAEEELHRIEWLLKKSLTPKTGRKDQPYGDLTELNTCRMLMDAVPEDMLADIASDCLDLLDTSAAVYEKNGDYALGIFSSGWCRFLDNVSRSLCRTSNNSKALASGKWHCHESCWTDASMVAIETGQPVDIECRGGIRLYAVPIRAGSEIEGSINFGYGDPPVDHGKLREIAKRYRVSVEELTEYARAYESRPPYIIDIAKRRLITSANLIGTIVKRRTVERDLQKAKDELEARVKERTAELSSTIEILNREISERKKAEEELENERHKLYSLLEALPAFVYLQAPDHSVRFANRNFRERFGNPDGRLCHDILWGRKEPCEVCPTFRVFDTGEPQVWEWEKTPDGRVYEVNDYPFTDIDGTKLVLELGFDITGRKTAEKKVKASLREKEILLKEIHHRVKNNMTVISSLLKLQADNIKDEKYRDMFDDSINRIKSMALIHERIYRSEDMVKVDFSTYLKNIVENMFTSYRLTLGEVELSMDIKDVSLGINDAIPLGLITNELLSNSLKHAFPEGRKGEIKVSVSRNDMDEVELIISDNGIGIPEGLDFRKSDSLGLNLVNTLTRQIKGQIKLHRERGTEFILTFREHE